MGVDVASKKTGDRKAAIKLSGLLENRYKTALFCPLMCAVRVDLYQVPGRQLLIQSGSSACRRYSAPHQPW